MNVFYIYALWDPRTTCGPLVIVAGQYAELRAQPPPDLLAGIEGR